MSVSVTKDDSNNEVTVVIKGRFDFSMNSEFRKILSDEDCHGGKYVIDMGAVEDLDSSALGMLLLLREKAGGDNSDIKISRCKPDIVEMLEMANFQTMFNIV